MDETTGGRVEAIWIKRFKQGPMDSVATTRAIAGRGLVDNANQGGKRQVTLITQEAWDTVLAQLGVDAGTLPPTTRRANVLVSGLDLADSRGKVVRLGDVRVRVYGETVPCNLMEESFAGLQDALRPEWRGGVFGEILDDGEIRVGDAAAWTSPSP